MDFKRLLLKKTVATQKTQTGSIETNALGSGTIYFNSIKVLNEY